MRIVLLLITLTAGAFGSAMYWMSDSQDNELAVVGDVTAGGLARVHAGAGKTATPAIASVDRSATEKPSDGAPPQRFFGAGLFGAGLATEPAAPAGETKSGPWQTDVVLSGRNHPSSNSAPVLVTTGSLTTGAMTTGSLPAPKDMPRDALVRDLQRELRRVGCYNGDANGEWTAGSKRALQAFLQHVNSTLPTATPDLIQLTLVRGYSGTGCRGDGSTIMARTPSPREPTRSGQAQVQQSAPLVAVKALPQQPAQKPAQQQQQQAAQASSTATVAPSPQASLQGQPQPAHVVQSKQLPTEATAQPPVVIFEGRMAIGGPRNPEAPDTSTSPPITSSAPVVPPPIRVARPKPTPQYAPSAQRARRDRSWTGNFFNQ